VLLFPYIFHVAFKLDGKVIGFVSHYIHQVFEKKEMTQILIKERPKHGGAFCNPSCLGGKDRRITVQPRQS
jgi:hypothetical protein